jgi:asparagine synthase (glutamine-hydrolysing)
MCGIAGYVDFSAPPDQLVLEGMTRALARRGPDAQATRIDGACGLAHTRLSIIDVAGSPQPMATPSGEVTIAFNGEIYNYERLRAELEAAGEQLATKGDTEALLRFVAREGAASLPRFDGMFAFAAWDRRRQRLLVARDAIGEKPLFFATPRPGLLVFGSEVKAVLEHPLVDRELDLDALRQVLRFRAVYGDGSLHRGVRQLRPGSWLEFDAEGLRIGRFHDLPAETGAERDRLRGRSESELIESGRSLLMDSVRERMIADVPVGAFLSGGLDSSVIVAAMRKIRTAGAELRTYSVGFRGDEHSELPFAQTVADVVQSAHTPIEVGPEAFLRRMAELAGCRDAPVSEPADVAVAEMSHIARQSVKVVLSGEGADEVFAGYPKYSLASSPAAMRWALRLTGADTAGRIAGLVGIDAARTRVAARALAQPTELGRIVQWFSHLSRAELKSLLPGLGWDDQQWAATVAEQGEALNALTRQGLTDPLLRMQMLDCLTWLPGNMLERGDRMTMAEGLEMRPPFLDKALTSFGLGLPANMKRRGKVGKWIVRQWARDLLPDEIVNRRKWGFRVPLASWFRGPLRDHLEGALFDGRGLCAAWGDRDRVRGLIESHMAGIDHSAALWSLYSAEIWYQEVFKPRLARAPIAAVA